jgi:D-beta-D-heptose 7-phosphate kinase/D-beta-D-heptose 1-phosphate adenosyltransferase
MAVTPLLDALPRLRVLVVGEAMLDCYLHGATGRLAREAPVPIVAVSERVDAPGGAANAAVNARALGATVTFLSVVGDDAEGAALRAALAARGVDAGAVLVDGTRRTLAKHRLLAGPQMLMRFDTGSTGALGRSIDARLAERLMGAFAEHDAIVVSDYGYGILSHRVIAALARCQARARRIIVTDSKRLGAYRDVGVTAVKPNYQEALGLLGPRTARLAGDRARTLARFGQRLLDITGAQIAAVTLDTDGALFFERGREPYRTYARPVEHSRAAGAGDTFASALALALAAGGDLAESAELASAAAAIVVGKDGTATCGLPELRVALSGSEKIATDAAALADRLTVRRAAGQRVVLTSGCFDILHSGHISYLNAAKALGDVLVVGLNTDAGVRRLKGAGRPINPLEERAHVLTGLSSVDYVVPFDEETPAELARALRPHVFVKGGDYTLERMPEAAVVQALGGEVRILTYVRDRSTTSVIERVRAAPARTALARAG